MNLFSNFVGGHNVNVQRINRPQQINYFKEYIYIETRLRVYPASFAFREDIEKGDKILLPSSALNELYPLLSSKNKDPMTFCIKNAVNVRLTYCGVL